MTLSFYLSWSPYATNSILAMAEVPLPRLLIVSAILFAKSGIIINPVLYIFFNADVRMYLLLIGNSK